MLECVINISEGTDRSVIDELAKSAEAALLDIHSDPYHNRSVFTLYGPDLYQSAIALTEKTFQLLDIVDHVGVHPRIGLVDVVPFVPLNGYPMAEAVKLSRQYALEVSSKFKVPIFLYGENRTLPEIRKYAFGSISPDLGPLVPHPRYGSIAVGAREVLVAYNLYLRNNDLKLAKSVAAEVRSSYFRTLGLRVGNRVQVSANLIDPLNHGIFEFFSKVEELAAVDHGELVGLAPLDVIRNTPEEYWEKLDVTPQKSIEIRSTSNQAPPDS